MYPPVFDAVNVPAVQALLKPAGGPLRFYLFGEAPQKVQLPYAVWRLVFGAPENYLGGAPDIDGYTIQIDVYVSPEDANPSQTCRSIAQALRDEIEKVAYVTSWLGESRDPDTKNYHLGFQADWLVNR